MTNRFAQIIAFIATRKRKLGVVAIALVALELTATVAIALFAKDLIGSGHQRRDDHGASVWISASPQSFDASLTIF